MIQYGPSSFKEKIATKEYFTKFIRCVTELPDPEDTVVNTVVQLTERETDRMVTHRYILVAGDSGNKWVDLDEYYRDAQLITAEGTYLSVTKDYIVGSSDWSGYLKLSWALPAGDIPKWLVIVRKQDSFPSTIKDGCELVSIVPPKNEETKEIETSGVYMFDDAMCGSTERENMKYSIFFVYASGLTKYWHE